MSIKKDILDLERQRITVKEESKDAWQCSKTTEDSAEDGCSVATVYSCYRQGKALGSDR